eukprot:scaffold3683_cov135-Skeletonema_dohrnii-CCMP3373.AAC.1
MEYSYFRGFLLPTLMVFHISRQPMLYATDEEMRYYLYDDVKRTGEMLHEEHIFGTEDDEDSEDELPELVTDKTLVGTLVTAGTYLLIPRKVNKTGRLLHGMTRSRYRIHIYRLWSMTVKQESLVEGCNTRRDEGFGNLIWG